MSTQTIIDYVLENWDNIVLAFLTLGLCLFTWRLSVQTRHLVIQTKRLADIQIEPRISIQAEWDSSEYTYELIVANKGQGAAKNVTCKFEGDNTKFRDTLIFKNTPLVDELHFIRHGIEQFEPGQSYRYFLGSSTRDAFAHAAESPWIFRLQYENLFGEIRKDTQIVEFALFRGDFSPPSKLHEIALILKEIQELLRKRG